MRKTAMKILLAISVFPFILSFSRADQLTSTTIKRRAVQLIAVDAGFGGSENGPSGCNGMVLAKDVNLKISEKIIARIKKTLSINAISTRSNDTYLSLEERVATANTKGADLLISVHTNGSDDASAFGIETFCLNLTAQPQAIKNAAIDSSRNKKNMADMKLMLSELIANTKIQDSNLLAKKVQDSLISHLTSKYDQINNRGVKQAPFYILLGTQMPSIMVETGFITNSNECKLLDTEEYQEDISKGVVEGIRNYLNEMRYKAFKPSESNGPDN